MSGRIGDACIRLSGAVVVARFGSVKENVVALCQFLLEPTCPCSCLSIGELLEHRISMVKEVDARVIAEGRDAPILN